MFAQKLRRVSSVKWNGDHPMAPAFRYDQPPLAGVDGGAIGKGEIARHTRALAAPEIDAPHGPAGVAVHQIGGPRGWCKAVRSVADIEFVRTAEGQRHRALEAFKALAAGLDPTGLKSSRECAVRVCRQRCDCFAKTGNGRAIRQSADVLAAGEQHLAFRGDQRIRRLGLTQQS